jgi:hypothetical protein
VDDSLEAQVDDLKNFLEAQKKDASTAKLQEEVNETYTIEHSSEYLEVQAENSELIYRSTFLRTHALGLSPPTNARRPIFKNRRFEGRHFRFMLQTLHAGSHVCSCR